MTLPIHNSDVELLVRVAMGTSMVALAEEAGCTPPNIARKVKRIKERLSWTAGMTVEQIRQRAGAVKLAGRSTGPEVLKLIVERDQLKAEVEALRKAAMPLDPVTGDQLPAIGSKVQIHLGRSDTWVEHDVVGYYVWGDLGGNQSLHRVFVRVRDADGYLNSRLLKEVRIQAAMSKEAS